MMISKNPASKSIPKELNTTTQKYKYLSSGSISVGEFSRFLFSEGTFETFFLPRIRSMNFSLGKHYVHPGYKTADQAYAVGVLLKKSFIKRAFEK